jgi:hypothetical protein
MDTVAAKQFLISRVIEEAELERVPLSDVEMSLNVTTTATSMKRKSRVS